MRTKNKKYIAWVGVAAFICLAALFPAQASAATVENWWPVEGAKVTGTQPFKGLLSGANVNDYQMFWYVDQGSWNWMDNNYNGYPHKEASVDVTGWNWRGNGPYPITFIARWNDGTVAAKKTFSIYRPAADIASPLGGAVAARLDAEVYVAPAASVPADVTISAGEDSKSSDNIGTGTATPASGRIITYPTPNAPVTAPEAIDMSRLTPTSPLPAAITPAPITPAPPGSNPFAAAKLYVNDYSIAKQVANSLRTSNPANAALIDKIAEEPETMWLGDWNRDIASDVKKAVDAAALKNTMPVFVLYNMINRDCGQYSAGGVKTPDQYRAWIKSIADAIGDRKAGVVLEPDALTLTDCLSQEQKNVRFGLIKDATAVFKAKKQIAVYIDAGHPNWVWWSDMADRLKSAGIEKADGFALNVSNFVDTAKNIEYGTQISGNLNGKHFIIDTSRNGNGSNGEWCNPSGRALGNRPTTSTGNALLDAFLWIKKPGESDGTCNGGPSAGVWWTEYALGLSLRASY